MNDKVLNLNSIRFIVHTLSKLFISQCNIWIKKWTGSVMYCKSLFPFFVHTITTVKYGEILRVYSEEMIMLVFVLIGKL